ncbi:reverse transcriptase domain-containing protein [Tanacetum coccineum]
MSIRAETLISLPFREEVERLLALLSPPPSPLSPWLSQLPQIPSPPLSHLVHHIVLGHHLYYYLLGPTIFGSIECIEFFFRLRAEAPSTSHLLSLPSPIVLPYTRASVAMIRVVEPSTYILASRSEAPPSGTLPLLPILLPTLSPPLLLPSTDHRADVREACLPPRKRLCFAFGPRYEVGESSSAPTARPDGDFRRDYGGCTSGRDHEVSVAADHRRHYIVNRGHKITEDTTNKLMAHLEYDRDRLEVLHSQMHRRRPAMIDQGVTAALAARDAIRSTNGKDSHNSGTGVRRNEQATHECTYPDFMKTVVNDVAYAMTWTELKKKMTDKYCSRTEIKKLKVELWDLKVKGTDVIGYNQHFQELALLRVRMFPKEYDKIERYVGGLPNMIHESVVASKPKTMQEATEIATKLMDKRIRTFADRQTENKRKQDNNQQQQLQNKRQNTGRAYAARTGEKKLYGGSKPLCPKCNYHHNGLCAPKCHKCNRVGHLARDCKSPANANTVINQRGTGTARNVNAPAKVYAVGHAGTNPDSNVVTGTFLLKNRYASILFDTGANRSFVSTAFSSQIDITPTALDLYYDVELADRRIIRLNTILRGCTLNILNHPFNIDLMPVELGSFDAIIGMDWLVKYQAIIVCAEKIVRLVGSSSDSTSGISNRSDTWCCTLAPSEMKELSEQLKELSDKGFIRPSSSP